MDSDRDRRGAPRGRARLTSRGGRRIKKTCPNCSGQKTEDCPKCTDGTNPCECTQELDGAISGYRALQGKRAFWDYVGATGRKGQKRQDYFGDVARKRALADQVGRTLGVRRARIESVEVREDRVLVQARVEWDGEDGEGLHTSVWIREKGRFYLLTVNDTEPEKLFD